MIDISFDIMNREDVKIELKRLDVEKANPPDYFYILSFRFPNNKKYDDYKLEIVLSRKQLEALRNLLEKEADDDS